MHTSISKNHEDLFVDELCELVDRCKKLAYAVGRGKPAINVRGGTRARERKKEKKER